MIPVSYTHLKRAGPQGSSSGCRKGSNSDTKDDKSLLPQQTLEGSWGRDEERSHDSRSEME